GRVTLGDEAGMGWRAVRRAPDVAAVTVIRSSRHRRRGCSSLYPLSGHSARGSEATVALSQQRTGFGMMLAAAVGFLLLLTFVFSGLIEDRSNPNRQVASSRVNGSIEVVLESDRQGHFIASGAISGREVTFLVDTGATLVSVPEDLANRLGLERMARIGLETAAGPVTGWMTRLDEVRLGDIVQRDVRA